MDRKTTSAAGLASSRGTRLLREAAFGTVALAMALGLAAWVTDFDLAAWTNPASANVGSTTSFDERFGPGFLRRSLAVNYPWRPAARSERSNFDTEFGHIESHVGRDRRLRSRTERSARAARPDGRGGNPAAKRPAGPGQSSVIGERPGAGFV